MAEYYLHTPTPNVILVSTERNGIFRDILFRVSNAPSKQASNEFLMEPHHSTLVSSTSRMFVDRDLSIFDNTT